MPTSKLWFKRKTYGWGWTPVTWQGWGVLTVFLIAIVKLSLRITPRASVTEVMFTFVIPELALVTILLWICYKKGEKPRWQWGKDT